MKKLIALFTAVTLLLVMTTTAFAKDRPPAPTEGVAAGSTVAVSEMRSMVQPLASALEIDYASNAISRRSSTCVRLSAITSTFMVCDKITNKFILQKWNGSAWVDYTSSVSISGYIMYEFICTTDKYIPSNAYYRVKTVHYAYRGTETDIVELISPYIYLE